MDILNNIKYFYSKNKTVVLNKAIASLREEIAANPNNINARKLLVDMLLSLAKQTDNENEQIEIYQQILKLDAKQQEAINALQKREPTKKPIRRNPKAIKLSPDVELKKLIDKKEKLLQERDEEIEILQEQVAAKTKQENILKQRLDNEKNALVNIESLTKDQEKRVDKYQQEVAGLKHELIIKEQALINLRETLKNFGQREKELTRFINDKQNETIAAKHESQNNNVLIILGTIIITIIIIFMGIISWQFSINNHNIPTPVVVPEPVKTPAIIIAPPPKKPVKITVVKPPIISQTLCVHFKKRSWIRISDDNNKKLYEGIRKPGEILALEGKPPFNMSVGNVNGVYVEYDCDINQVSAYPRREGKKNMFIIGDE
jgi:hypothetical protein